MGMDVIGLEPITEAGQYFRRNIWGWRRLADMVCVIAPRLTAHCEHWHSNDGDGLDAETSTLLAQELQAAIASGKALRLIAARDAAVAGLPREACHLCDGIGIRRDQIGVQAGQPERVIGPDTGAPPDHPRYGQTGWCNGCSGRGSNANFESHYYVSVDDIAEFARFLAGCGGFEIC